VKSEWMRDEIVRIHKVPVEKIRVVQPNSTSWVKEVLAVYSAAAGGVNSK
jgi:hypothetical protein